MSWTRRLAYRLAIPIGMGLIRLMWASCRIVHVSDAARLESRVFGREPAIVCYWHRHQLFCWRYLRELIGRGARIGWLISASVDGEVPSGLARRMGGGIVFRGSTTSRGSKALRAMCKALAREGLAIAATPDGPRGPRSKFKPGIVKLAQLSGAPLVPLAWAARRAWVLGTWDRFVIPKPLTRIVVAVGEPVHVPRRIDDGELARIQARMESALEALFKSAQEAAAASHPHPA